MARRADERQWSLSTMTLMVMHREPPQCCPSLRRAGQETARKAEPEVLVSSSLLERNCVRSTFITGRHIPANRETAVQSRALFSVDFVSHSPAQAATVIMSLFLCLRRIINRQGIGERLPVEFMRHPNIVITSIWPGSRSLRYVSGDPHPFPGIRI